MAVAKKQSDVKAAAPRTARVKLTNEEKAAKFKEQNKIRQRNRLLQQGEKKERLAAELLAAETELDRKKRESKKEKARAKRADRFFKSW
ncbi:hypothetical protein B484DRAFT_409606 [Ochromonadaceae sp. CCMP2298]|nr:hypothetical protein B484DRAFT_409606 [Ochromonadaceae sp. CCMP2298]